MDKNKQVMPFEGEQALVRVGVQMGLVNKVLEEDEILIPYRKGNLWGFCNWNKKIIIPYIFDDVNPFSEGLAVVKKDKKYGYIDKKGKVIIACQFDNVESFSEGLAVVEKDKKYGYIDKKGKVIIDLKFRCARSFVNGRASVNESQDWWFIDKNGDNLGLDMDLEYYARNGSIKNFRKFLNGYYRLLVDKKWYFETKEGISITSLGFEDARDFKNGFARVKMNRRWGFINEKGDLQILCEFDFVEDFSNEGLAAASKNGKWGFIDLTGKEVISFIYESVGSFSEGLAAVTDSISSKIGFINELGRLIIPLKYSGTFSHGFSEGITFVYDNEIIYYIDKNGVEYWEK